VLDKLIDLYYKIIDYIQNKQLARHRDKLDYELQKTALDIEKDCIECGKIKDKTKLYLLKAEQGKYKKELGSLKIP
jgi:hypothetical protein